MRAAVVVILAWGTLAHAEQRYTMKPGETLEYVARAHGCSTDAVLRANRRDNVLVPAGTVVTIPACGGGITARARTREVPADGRTRPAVPRQPSYDDAHYEDDPEARAQAALATIDGKPRAMVPGSYGTSGSSGSSGAASVSGSYGTSSSHGTSGSYGSARVSSSSGSARTSGSATGDGHPQSIGLPWNGRLQDGRALPQSRAYVIRRPARAFGTDRTIAAITAAIALVRSRFPEAPVLAIGDISAEHGGRIAEHLSHQSGRDADIGFYFTRRQADYPAQFVVANADFDLPKNFALLTAFLPYASMIFLDTAVQARLYKYAAANGMDEAELARIFQYPRGADAQVGIVRHWPHHGDHFHVRFAAP